MFLRFWHLLVLAIALFSLIECNVKIKAWINTGKISSVFATPGLYRPYMEDRHIRREDESGYGVYAIFDGHSGEYSSIFAMEFLSHAIENEIKFYKSNGEYSKYTKGPDYKLNFKPMLIDLIDRVEIELKSSFSRDEHRSGTTCLVVIAEEKKLTVANVGDSRGVMCNQNGIAVDLSVDHKPNNPAEKKRIEENGEQIYESFPGIWRVRGLAMSRSLGDHTSKGNKNAISATPDVLTFDLDEHKPQFMILASDGLWDVMSSQAAVDFIKERYLSNEDFGTKDLVIKALNLKSKDNITVVVVLFKDGHYEVASASSSASASN